MWIKRIVPLLFQALKRQAPLSAASGDGHFLCGQVTSSPALTGVVTCEPALSSFLITCEPALRGTVEVNPC